MPAKSEKALKGYLYSEIARLKQQLATQSVQLATQKTDDQAWLPFWTRKCGLMGNEIGRLRKQLLEVEAQHQTILALWEDKCEKLTKELDEIRKKVLTNDTEHNTSKKDDVVKEIDEGEIPERQSFDVNELVQDIDNRSIDPPSNAIETISENQQNRSDEMEEIEVDIIVQSFCNSDSDADVGPNGIDSIKNEDLIDGNKTNSSHFVVQPLQQDEASIRKSKNAFWSALKKRVSMKKARSNHPVVRSSTSSMD